MPPAFTSRGAFRRGSPDRAPLRALFPEPCSRWPAGAGAARLHRGSKTSTRPFCAPLSRALPGPRALRRPLQIDVSTSTTMDRSSTPDRGIRGRGGLVDRSLPFDRRRPLKLIQVRGRGSPSLDAHPRDCSRERLRPDPDCFRHLVSRALPVTLSGVDAGARRSRRRCES